MASRSWNCCGGGAREPRREEGATAQAAEETTRRASAFDCWDWCAGGRSGSTRGGIGFGYVLIVLGLLWLGGVLGWIRAEIIWPVFVIVVGLWLAVFSRIRWRRKS